MGEHTAIADAGETVVKLLRSRTSDLLTDDQIALASPVDEDLANKVRLTLYLFDVDESGHVRNNNSSEPLGAGDPLRLDLMYLLTAHRGRETGESTTTAKNINEHTVLGRAMQVLQDNAIVNGPDLTGSLGAGDETLRISILPESTDTLVNLWSTFSGEPYRPSVAYLVTPVEVESRERRPVKRVEQVKVKEHTRISGTDE